MLLFHIPKVKEEGNQIIIQWIEYMKQESAWTENRHESLDTVAYILNEWTVARNIDLEQWNSKDECCWHL